MLSPNAIPKGSITQEMIDVSVLDAKQDVIDDLYTIREGAKIGNEAFDIITSMVNAGYLFAGIATPITDPSEPNAKVFYIANGKGKYEKFGGLEVTEDEVVVLYWDSAWHKVETGIASQEKLSELESQLTDLYGIEEVEKVSTTTDTYITPDRSWLVQVQNGHKYRLVINAQWGITQFSGISQDNAMLYVDNGNGSTYFSHSLSMGFSVLEHTLTANTETLNIRYRADNGSIVSLSIIDISDQKTLYALDKRIVIDAILSEAFTVDSLTRDSDGNVISGNIKYSDGIAGTIAITRNADGNATSMVATHGTDSYTLSIMRNANGDVTKTSIN